MASSSPAAVAERADGGVPYGMGARGWPALGGPGGGPDRRLHGGEPVL